MHDGLSTTLGYYFFSYCITCEKKIYAITSLIYSDNIFENNNKRRLLNRIGF